MTEDKNQPAIEAKEETPVKDLEVAEADAKNIKGGLSLNYTKVKINY